MGQVTRTNFGLVSQLRLTDAQIKTLFSAPVVLVPARLDTMWIPIGLVILSKTVAGIYATAANVLVKAGAATWATISLANSGLTSGALEFSYTGILNTTPIVGAAIVNTAITLTANADPTGGNVANFSTVQLYYAEVPTV